jgi:hypothetical protein
MTITDPQLDRLLRKAAKGAIAKGFAGKHAAAIRSRLGSGEGRGDVPPGQPQVCAESRAALARGRRCGRAGRLFLGHCSRSPRENKFGRIMERIGVELCASASEER